MATVKRVYVGGLFHDITENDLKEKFKRFGEIDEIEIKHKRSAEGVSEKTFAYINLKTSEADYQKCLSIFNKSKWKGFQLHLQLAKEDFIKRLKIERENGFKIEDDKKARKKNIVQNVLEDVPEVQNYTVKGAAPGTPVPRVKNWVVGKNGHVEPVVYMRRNYKMRMMKVDPSNYLKNHKTINKKEETTVKENITWQLEEKDTDIVKKQKGEFPEWQPKYKKRRFSDYGECSDRNINDDFEVVREVDTCSAPHSMNYSESDSDSDYTSMKQKLTLNTVKSPQTNKHSDDPDSSVSTKLGLKGGNTCIDSDRTKSNRNTVKEKHDSIKQQKQNKSDKMKKIEETDMLGKQSELKMKKNNVKNSVHAVLSIENLQKHSQSASDNEMSDAESVSSVGTDEIIKKTKEKISKTIDSPFTSVDVGKLKYVDEFSSGMFNGNNEEDEFSDLVDDDSLDGENYEFLAQRIEAEYRNKNSNTPVTQITENVNISLTHSDEQSSNRKIPKGKKNLDEGNSKQSKFKTEKPNLVNKKELKSVTDNLTSSTRTLDSKKNSSKKVEKESDTNVSSGSESDDEYSDSESSDDVKNSDNSESESDDSDDDFQDITSDESSRDVKKVKDTRKIDSRSHPLKGIPAFRGTKDLYTEGSDLVKETDKDDGSRNQITSKTKYVETNNMKVDTTEDHQKQCKQNSSVKKAPVIRDEIEQKKESNQKRLESIKQKQQESKVQKSAIKEALSNVDKVSTPNKKIIFDSDTENESTAPSGVDLVSEEDSDSESMNSDSTTEDEEDSDSSTQNDGSDVKTPDKKQTLFDSSDDDDSSDEDGKSDDEKMFRIRPEFEGMAGKKLIELQSRYKNDERFKLDARFRDEDENDDPENDLPHDEEDEKLRSLKILREVVGKKAVISIDKDTKNKKMFKDMSALHFDPSREDHSQFEVKTSKDDDKKSSEKTPKKKKKKKDEQVEDVEEEDKLPEVSKDRFYEVASTFKDAFGDKKEASDNKVESFSLLSAFGQTATTAESDTEEEDQGNTLIPSKGGEFLWQQPFKYDSSDSNDEEDETMHSADESDTKKPNVVVFGTKPTTFFFSENDERIKEGVQSFCRQEEESVIREQWQQKRQQLVDGYRTKHKRLNRRRKQNEKFRHQFQK